MATAGRLEYGELMSTKEPSCAHGHKKKKIKKIKRPGTREIAQW